MILARELKGKDMTVHTVAPGPTATPLFLNGTKGGYFGCTSADRFLKIPVRINDSCSYWLCSRIFCETAY